MKLSVIALVIVVSLLAIATVFATAHMHDYSNFTNQTSSEFRSRMQQEMNEILELQQKYQSGQVTQQQYQQGLQEHWQDMQEIHNSTEQAVPWHSEME